MSSTMHQSLVLWAAVVFKCIVLAKLCPFHFSQRTGDQHRSMQRLRVTRQEISTHLLFLTSKWKSLPLSHLQEASQSSCPQDIWLLNRQHNSWSRLLRQKSRKRPATMVRPSALAWSALPQRLSLLWVALSMTSPQWLKWDPLCTHLFSVESFTILRSKCTNSSCTPSPLIRQESLSTPSLPKQTMKNKKTQYDEWLMLHEPTIVEALVPE